MAVLIVILVFLQSIVVLFDTRKGILAAILTRPLIDCFWQAKDLVLGVKPTEINGVVLPLLILFKIIISREHKLFRSPFAIALALYSFYQFLPIVMIASDEGVRAGLSYLFRSLHTFVGFVAFQEFFHEKKDFKKLLLFYIVAGLLPLGMSFYQNVLGGVIRTESNIGELTRNIGFYHDSFTIRFYSLQTLLGIILYLSYFVKNTQAFLKGILITLGLFCVFTVHRLYSKAGYLIMVQWAFIWLLCKKQIIMLSVLIITGIAGFFIIPFNIAEDVKEVYSIEIGAMQGQERTELLFKGRMGGWLRALDHWQKDSLVHQLFGTGTTALGAHNDFLRSLLGTGLIGLLFYSVILGWALSKATANVLQAATPLNIMALMLLLMWLIDAAGLVPGGYPAYQLTVWGITGLAFRGVEGINGSDQSLENHDYACQ